MTGIRQVIPLDDEIGKRGFPGGKVGVEVQGHEVPVQGLVVLDFIPFPHQPEFGSAVAFPQ
jgi:hypothetical protein